MLFLVLADNFLFIYIAWELVGLCSYLLIGFWFERPAAARAALKAFIVTRVGDFSMMIGILLLFLHTGSLRFDEIFRAIGAGASRGPVLTLARAARVRRRRREVRAGPAARLAAGRDGGPHAGQRADPRGDDGRRRGVPGRPRLPAVPTCPPDTRR